MPMPIGDLPVLKPLKRLKNAEFGGPNAHDASEVSVELSLLGDSACRLPARPVSDRSHSSDVRRVIRLLVLLIVVP